jgi:hypothetical protein
MDYYTHTHTQMYINIYYLNIEKINYWYIFKFDVYTFVNL